MAPLHLHGLWTLFLLGYLSIVGLAVTVALVVWWSRWDREPLDRWSRHRLVVAAVFGVVLTGLYWTSVLAGAVDIVPRGPVQAAIHAAGSIAGLAGGAVLLAFDARS